MDTGHPSRRVVTSLLSAVISVAISTASVVANDRIDTYGDRGYVWLGHYRDFGYITVTSDNCNARETGAFDRVENSTAGTTEFSARWPSGIRLTRSSCTGTVTASIDISLDYSDFDVTHNGADAPGENHSPKATPEWCDLWPSAPAYPCGTHPSRVHINLDWWNSSNNNSRERLIMHETGHSMGLDHHCSSDSIMNTGADTCNQKRWTEVMVYKPTDRNGIVGIYPCWICP